MVILSILCPIENNHCRIIYRPQNCYDLIYHKPKNLSWFKENEWNTLYMSVLHNCRLVEQNKYKNNNRLKYTNRATLTNKNAGLMTDQQALQKIPGVKPSMDFRSAEKRFTPARNKEEKIRWKIGKEKLRSTIIWKYKKCTKMNWYHISF